MELSLPEINLSKLTQLEKAIYERESIRSFYSKEIELDKLSKLFWAAQGLKGYKRTVPSAGATYPLEIYAILKDKGVFNYNLKKHCLNLVIDKDVCKQIARASWHQSFICEPYLIIIICADYERTASRYGSRAIRYVHIEVGHCAQNIHLMATALGLGSVPIGAFNDKAIKNILELPKNLDPLYIIPIGYPK